MSKIKILAIPSDKHGVGKFRMMDPYKFIDENFDDIHVDITFDAERNDEYFLNYDIVVFHTFIHKTNHDDNIQRIKWLKDKGIKIIMDIDDLWFVDQRHPMYETIKHSFNLIREFKDDGTYNFTKTFYETNKIEKNKGKFTINNSGSEFICYPDKGYKFVNQIELNDETLTLISDVNGDVFKYMRFEN